jgi:hypothetical protein
MEDEMKDEMEQKSLNMPKSLWALIEDARLRFIETTGVKIGRNSYMRSLLESFHNNRSEIVDSLDSNRIQSEKTPL